MMLIGWDCLVDYRLLTLLFAFVVVLFYYQDIHFEGFSNYRSKGFTVYRMFRKNHVEDAYQNKKIFQKAEV